MSKCVIKEVDSTYYVDDSFRSTNYGDRIYKFEQFDKVRKFLKGGGKIEDVEWSYMFDEKVYNKMFCHHGWNKVISRKDLEEQRDNPGKPATKFMAGDKLYNSRNIIIKVMILSFLVLACSAAPFTMVLGDSKVITCGDSNFMIPKTMPEDQTFGWCCRAFQVIPDAASCFMKSLADGTIVNGSWTRNYLLEVEGKGIYKGICTELAKKCRLLTDPSYQIEDPEVEEMPKLESDSQMRGDHGPPYDSDELTTTGGAATSTEVLSEELPLNEQPQEIESTNMQSWDPTNGGDLFINHDGCRGEEVLETYVRLINEKELCIIRCLAGNKTEVSFETRSPVKEADYIYPQCWEESKKQYLELEDRDIISEVFKENFDGTRRITVCELDVDRTKSTAVARFKIWLGKKPAEVYVWESCASAKLPKDCRTEIKGGYTEVTVEMKAKYGGYDLHIGDTVYKGYFKGSKLIRTDFEKSGEILISGSCNDIPFKRRIIVTSKEYCDEKYSSVFEYHWNVHCKHHRVIWILFEVIGISVAVYCLSRVLSAFLSAFLSVAFTVFSYCCLNRMICHRCSRFKLPGKGHYCNPRECIYCGSTILTESDMSRLTKEEVSKVMESHRKKTCTSFTTDRPWALCIINYYRLFYSTLYFLMRQAPALTIAVCTIWLLGIYQGAEAMRMEDIHRRIVVEATKCVGEAAEKIVLESEKKERRELEDCVVISTVPFIILLTLSIVVWIAHPLIAPALTYFGRRWGTRQCKLCGLYKGTSIHNAFCKNIKCPRCDVRMGIIEGNTLPEHITSFIWGHIDTCESIARTNGLEDLTKRSYRGVVKSVAKKLSIVSLPYMAVLAMLILATCLKTAEANHVKEMTKQESDLGRLILDLKREGFHPYHARFTSGLREDISAVEEVTDCSNDICTLKMVMESELMIREGREYGYNLCPKKKLKDIEGETGCTLLNVKIGEVFSECDYKIEYKTGKAKHKQFSSDTCTGSCAECQGQLDQFKKSNVEVYMFNHENTASWSCDGPGCLAINNGCTCGMCYCEIMGDETEVRKVVKEEPFFDLCIQIGGEGFCKTVGREERGKRVTVIKEGEKTDICPEIIACENEICLKGEINKRGEFDNKYGAVQKIGLKTAAKREERYTEHCLFAKHRWVSYDQCCKDTEHMKRNLEPTHLIKTSKQGQFRKIAEDLGTWKIRIEMPTLTFHKKLDDLKLRSLEIRDCKGCASCDEGGSCLLQYTSNYKASVKFNCDECRTDVSHIMISKGVQQTKFNIFCKEKKTKLKCTVGNSTVTTDIALLERPSTPHGDGVIVMDKEKFVDEKCKTLLCGMNFSFWNLWSYATYIIIFVVAIVLIIIIYKSASGIVSFFKKIK